MQQIDSETYTVRFGEIVTLTISAHQVAEDLAVSFGEHGKISPIASEPAVYKFTIAEAPISQFAVVAGHLFQ